MHYEWRHGIPVLTGVFIFEMELYQLVGTAVQKHPASPKLKMNGAVPP
jgi:hypothetical protein